MHISTSCSLISREISLIPWKFYDNIGAEFSPDIDILRLTFRIRVDLNVLILFNIVHYTVVI